MSQYSSIWSRLKDQKTVTLAVHPKLHPRLIKAVTTRKYKDTGYRLELAESSPPRRAILSHISEQSKLRFILTIYAITDELSVADL